jgi:prepilin-type N-terminal cleavage/methylation domain-containing protein
VIESPPIHRFEAGNGCHGSNVSGAKRQEGFTLIELALVLMIVGIVLGLGAGVVGSLLKDTAVKKTKETIDATFDAVVGFTASNKRLPATAPTNEFLPILRTPTDNWGRTINYVYDNNLIAAPAGGADICGRRTTTLSIRRCNYNPCTDADLASWTDISNVAMIIWSNGPNYNNQLLDDNNRTINVNTGPFAGRVRASMLGTQDVPAVGNPTGLEFDDIVKWVTIDELRTRAGCQGSPLKILNNELPFGSKSINYVWNVNPLATVFVEGGVPYTSVGGNYRWCIQTTAPTGITVRSFYLNLGVPQSADITLSVFNADCLTWPEANWQRSDKLIVSGQPSTEGSYGLTFFVRDDQDSGGANDNIEHKTFVLTINP